MRSVNLLVTDRSPESAEHINSMLRNSGINIHVFHAGTSMDVKRALDHDTPLLILYADPDEAEAPLDEVIDLANAFDVQVALYTDLEDSDKLLRLLRIAACVVIDSANEELLTSAVARLVEAGENQRRFAARQERAEELEQRYNLLLESSRDAIAYVHEGLHVYANRAYLEALRVKDQSDLAGLTLLEMLTTADTDLKKLLRGLSRGSFPSEPLAVEVQRPDGSVFGADLVFSPARFDGEDCTQMMMQHRDAANELAAELERLRQTDPLTRLANRKTFARALGERIEAGPGEFSSAVLYVEPDGFAELQDELDAETLDAFISDQADTIRYIVETDDVVARIGDCGFAVLAQRRDSAELEALAEAILEGFRSHIVEIGDRALSVSCSIGMNTIGRLSVDPGETLAQARKAQAEAAGVGDRLVVCRPQLTPVASIDGEQQWIERIKYAIGNQDFYSVQQSIINLDGDGDPLVENITFLHGESGDHSPEEFALVAERNDLAGTIDHHVIPALLKTFVDNTDRQVINISGNSLLDYAFPGWFAEQLKTACAEGDRIVLQIAAGNAHTNLRPAQRLIKEVAPLGCRLAISEFDGQRRTLQLLDHLDVVFVKLKRELTAGLTGSTDSQEAIRKIVSAADAHGVEVIADQVADTSSLAVLWQCGVKLVSGAFLQDSSQVLAQ